ncbi:DUF3579 domain-containing protein [Derxia gummosa]|uniref:DUF3579 domain-containing protein n=1 Tax=Derxia gummosa DSM 723 TaxID=1121388 RepID=A0A8B6X1M3_9BURK|nr:DUF3579 domain-containing protein [Derxia gummosa]
MADPIPNSIRQVVILGKTQDGKTFRPSDWAERLCGVMSPFRPNAGRGVQSHIGYSPYVRPSFQDGIKCVIVDTRLRDIEPMALQFVLNFAADNNLQTISSSQPPAPAEPA